MTTKNEERLRNIKEIYYELLYCSEIIRFTGFKGDSRSYIRDKSISRINTVYNTEPKNEHRSRV